MDGCIQWKVVPNILNRLRGNRINRMAPRRGVLSWPAWRYPSTSAKRSGCSPAARTAAPTQHGVDWVPANTRDRPWVGKIATHDLLAMHGLPPSRRMTGNGAAPFPFRVRASQRTAITVPSRLSDHSVQSCTTKRQRARPRCSGRAAEAGRRR
jgi:hypothetical protein